MVGFDKLSCNGNCYICGVPLNPTNSTRDHFIAKAMGGPDSIDNLRPACTTCNKTKRDSKPTVALMVMLYVYKTLRKRFNKRVSRSVSSESLLIDTSCPYYVIEVSYYGIIHSLHFIELEGAVEVKYTASLNEYSDLLEYLTRLVQEAYSHIDYFKRVVSGEWPIAYWENLNIPEEEKKMDTTVFQEVMESNLNSVVESERAQIENTTAEVNESCEYKSCKCELCGVELDISEEDFKSQTHPVCQDCIDYILDNSLLPVSVLKLLRERRELLVCEDRLIQLQQQNEVLLQKLSDMQEIVKSLNTQFESVLPSNL